MLRRENAPASGDGSRAGSRNQTSHNEHGTAARYGVYESDQRDGPSLAKVEPQEPRPHQDRRPPASRRDEPQRDAEAAVDTRDRQSELTGAALLQRRRPDGNVHEPVAETAAFGRSHRADRQGAGGSGPSRNGSRRASMATPARSTLLSLMSSASSPSISPPVIGSVDASATMPAVNVERTTLAVLRRNHQARRVHLDPGRRPRSPQSRRAERSSDLRPSTPVSLPPSPDQMSLGERLFPYRLAVRCRRSTGRPATIKMTESAVLPTT